MSVEFVGIELELRGADSVYRDLQKIDGLLNSWGGRKKVSLGLADLKRESLATQSEIKRLTKELARLYGIKAKFGDSASVFVDRDIKKYSGQLTEARKHLEELKQAEREVSLEARNMEKSFRQVARGITSSLSSLGGRITTLGKALGRIANPLSNLMRGTFMAAGGKALNMVTEGLGGTFERADTMKLYPKMLEEFEFSAEKSQAAIDKLEESVLGLPTGLDEIVAVQKRFVAASQDMDKATGLAIAYNNAILASGSDARQQWTAQRIITQLAGGAQIAATSWDALQRAIPLVFTELSKDANMGVGDYVNALKKGEISTEEFMAAFTKIGGEGGTIAAVAQKMTKSWQGLTANITNATKRMGTAILDSLHEVFMAETGRDLLDTLLGLDAEGNRTYDGIRDWIDGISKSIQDWIKANPDTIIDFFETLKSIDVKGLLKGIAQGIGDLVGLAKQLAEYVGNKDLSKLGRFYTWLLPISGILTTAGGLLKGLSPILGVLGAGILKGFGGKGKGLFGKLMGLFGKKKEIAEAGEAAKEIPTVAQSFRGAFNALQGLIKAAGAVIIVTGTGAFAFKAVKSMIKDLKDIGNELKEMTWLDAVHGANIIMSIGLMTKVFEALGGLFGPEGLRNAAIAGAISFIVAGSFAADMWAVKTGIRQLKDTILGFDEVASAIEGMKGFTNFTTAKQKVSQMVDAISEIVSLFQGQSANHKEGTEREGGLKRLGKGKVNTITNLTNALDGIKKAVDKLNQLASVGIASNARSKAHLVMSAIRDVMDEFSSLTWMTSPTKNLKKNVTNLAEALKQVNKLANRINTLAGLSVNTEGFASFVQQIKTALNELKSIEGDLELDVEVKLASGFQASINNVIKKINDARNKIAQESNKAVNVTIPINVKFRVKTNVGSAINAIHSGASAVRDAVPRYPAKGGLIYRAKGGDVSWKRRGTDTVPAMLTPGEYVHNKRAVNMFGIDFMRKVNSLDMKGAMNELMHRAGNMANINRGTTINNNTYNNQRATINVTTNSAEFTGRLASRFVGAF